MAEQNITEKAWNAVKDKDDPVFALCAPDHKTELLQRTDGVIRTGVTVDSGGVYQDFEEKVKELHDAESRKSAPKAKAVTTAATATKETPKAESQPATVAKAETATKAKPKGK